MYKKFNLTTNQFEMNDKRQRFSKYCPKGMINILSLLPDDEYVLSVGYNNDNEIQIGITGTPYNKESVIDALLRESNEELQIGFSVKNMDHSINYIDKDRKTWFCGSININNCYKKSTSIDNKHNSSFKKVGLIVHGKEQEIYNFISNNYSNYIDNDDISHIVMVKVAFIKERIYKLNLSTDSFMINNWWFGNILNRNIIMIN